MTSFFDETIKHQKDSLLVVKTTHWKELICKCSLLSVIYKYVFWSLRRYWRYIGTSDFRYPLVKHRATWALRHERVQLFSWYINYREAEDAMDYNLHPKTQRVQQLHEKKHLGHDPTTSCENVRYISVIPCCCSHFVGNEAKISNSEIIAKTWLFWKNKLCRIPSKWK